MFDKKKDNTEFEDKSRNDVFRPAKGDAKVVIGNGVSITGEIKKADEVQIMIHCYSYNVHRTLQYASEHLS